MKILVMAFIALATTTAFAQSKTDLDLAIEMAKEVYGDECYALQEESEYFQPTEYELDSKYNVKLLELPCFRGAYNFGTVYFLKNVAGYLFPVSFSEPAYSVDYADENYEQLKSIQVEGFKTTNILINANYEPESGVLVSYSKWRGVGDASSTATWEFAGGSFVLKRYEVDPTYNGEIDPMTLVDYN